MIEVVNYSCDGDGTPFDDKNPFSISYVRLLKGRDNDLSVPSLQKKNRIVLTKSMGFCPETYS